MNIHDVLVFWWFFGWFMASLMPLYYDLQSIRNNNYSTKEDKYLEMTATAIVWVIIEFAGMVGVWMLSKLLKII